MTKTCFVIMPIGEIEMGGVLITAEQLKERYDDLIKEALLRERPDLVVVRADEVAAPGGITTDIFTRLMHADYVIADITYPNMNVYYELGIRHACRPGTLLIRDKAGPKIPFDVAALRHVEYDNSPSGLKSLAKDLRQRLAWFDANPGRPDNDFLSLAQLTSYQFQNYSKKDDVDASTMYAFSQMLQIPEVLEMFGKSARGEAIDQAALLGAIAQKPEALAAVLGALVKTGQLKF